MFSGEQMHNSEKNNLKLILECINGQYVNMALFNSKRKGSYTYFPIRTNMVFSFSKIQLVVYNQCCLLIG